MKASQVSLSDDISAESRDSLSPMDHIKTFQVNSRKESLR